MQHLTRHCKEKITRILETLCQDKNTRANKLGTGMLDTLLMMYERTTSNSEVRNRQLQNRQEKYTADDLEKKAP